MGGTAIGAGDIIPHLTRSKAVKYASDVYSIRNDAR